MSGLRDQHAEGESPWSEDEQFKEAQKACVERRAIFGEDLCEHDGSGGCTECVNEACAELERRRCKFEITPELPHPTKLKKHPSWHAPMYLKLTAFQRNVLREIVDGALDAGACEGGLSKNEQRALRIVFERIIGARDATA